MRSVRQPLPHDSAVLHVTGEARYIDDLPVLPGTLFCWAVLSDRAHARIVAVELEKARQVAGVRVILTGVDLPPDLRIGPVFADEPVLATGEVLHEGQAVAVVAAESEAAAHDAASLVAVSYEDLPAILTIEEALAAGATVGKTSVMKRGDAAAAIARAPHVLDGEIAIGGQEHFYLEGQVAYAIPQEDGRMRVHSSTQNPTEVQHLVAKVLGLTDAGVTVEVRRIGGGFGGKETQPAQIACVAALIARRTGRPAKWRLDRDHDIRMTGKRHEFRCRARLGHDADGRILGAEIDLAARCGYSADLSNAVVDRAMFHADNGYFLGQARVTGHRCHTNTVSNTAFRGFGGPQGMLAIENALDDVARTLGKDPLDVRRLNLYGPGREGTHYGQMVEDNILPELFDELEASSDYRRRRREIDAFNRAHDNVKRGLALTPVKFGISFTATHLNQAGALVHVYTDGSIHLNHGGIEMGQGLNIKIAQVVAEEFCVDAATVQVTATTTGKVPNTSPTAASAGADLNGMAARAACRTIKERLVAFAARQWSVPEEQVAFEPGHVRAGAKTMTFCELVRAAWHARVSLSATGFYRTPKIHWDAERMTGRPFFYFTYGAATTEAEIDTLTGEYRFVRADLLQDVGSSLNPAIDLGQTEGGFVQGLGWLTSEELWWDASGRLRTYAPSTYKIPTSRDVPPDFRVTLRERPNREETVFRSKAIGEPPLMLAISGFLAIKDAVAAVAGGHMPVRLDAPATPERVLLACEALRQRLRETPRKAAE